MTPPGSASTCRRPPSAPSPEGFTRYDSGGQIAAVVHQAAFSPCAQPMDPWEAPWSGARLLPACSRGRPYDGIVQSDAIDVDSYLTQVPEGRRAVLTEIRDACRRLLAGFAESMSYGMPAYSRDGTAEIAWASQKRYISLYVMRADVLDAHRGQLVGLDVGKGCIRYRSPAAVDFTVVHSILTAVAASRGPVC